MAKYERDWDSEIFDEDEIEDAIAEEIDDNDDIIKEAMYCFPLEWIFKHLDAEAQMEIYDKAREIALGRYFIEVDDDEIEDDEEDE